VITEAFVTATKAIRDTNRRSETWITRSTEAIASGLFVLAVACLVEAL
jgi:hypothetical protein